MINNLNLCNYLRKEKSPRRRRLERVTIFAGINEDVGEISGRFAFLIIRFADFLPGLINLSFAMEERKLPSFV